MDQGSFGLVGVGALQNLNGYIYELDNQYDYFTVFLLTEMKK